MSEKKTKRVGCESSGRDPDAPVLESRGLSLLFPELAADLARRFEELTSGLSRMRTDASADDRAAEELEELMGLARGGRELTLKALQLLASDRLIVEPCEVSSALGGCQPLLRTVLPASVETRFDLGVNLPPVNVDEPRLVQVLTYLALGAARSMEKGGTLSISTGYAECDRDRRRRDFQGGEIMRLGGYVYLEISDPGEAPSSCWIDPGSTDIRSSCLRHAWRLVEQSYGGMAVQTGSEGGGLVTVMLPVVPARDEAAEMPLAEGWHAGRLVLVVDGDEEARGAAALHLERLGFETMTAGGGQEALELMARRSSELALVLADAQLAGEREGALVSGLREHSAELPILLSHVRGVEARIPATESSGPVEWIHKPFRRPSLRKTIRRLLDPRGER